MDNQMNRVLEISNFPVYFQFCFQCREEEEDSAYIYELRRQSEKWIASLGTFSALLGSLRALVVRIHNLGI